MVNRMAKKKNHCREREFLYKVSERVFGISGDPTIVLWCRVVSVLPPIAHTPQGPHISYVRTKYSNFE